MNNFSPFPGNTPQVSSYLTQQRQRNTSQEGLRILQWWYRITSPPEPADSAPFEERELFRRGRTGSQITIFLFFLIFISFPAAFAGSNSLLIAILSLSLLIVILAMALNRFRRVTIAGILVVLSLFAGPTVNILTTPGGINTSALSIFGLLVLPLICAASFLPPWWVFVVAAGNCLFTLAALSFMPSSGELHEVLKVAFPGVVTPILLSQIIVSLVAFLWVRGAQRAIVRADRAEEIAKLEALEIERQEEQLATSKQIEEGIQQIITTMNAVIAHNNFSIRVPLSQEHILWRASKSINNLLSRLQGLKQSQEELKKTHAIAAEVVQYMRDGRPIPLRSWTGTACDAVILEYNNLVRNIPRETPPQVY